MTVSLRVNGRRVEVHADPQTPLLHVLRDELKLTGTKYGCGRGLCGACTVHVDEEMARSCLLPAGSLEGRDVTTIEGVSEDDPVIKAWRKENVPQCGYCQSGQIMSASALLRTTTRPSSEEISKHMSGNICRCGTYLRIRAAILRAAREKQPVVP